MADNAEELTRIVEEMLRRAVNDNADLAELLRTIPPMPVPAFVGVSITYETN
jgi:hypothetical protein